MLTVSISTISMHTRHQHEMHSQPVLSAMQNAPHPAQTHSNPSQSNRGAPHHRAFLKAWARSMRSLLLCTPPHPTRSTPPKPPPTHSMRPASQGFPDSVGPQYAQYMAWRGVQYFFGGAMSVFTTKCLLGALGVAGRHSVGGWWGS